MNPRTNSFPRETALPSEALHSITVVPRSRDTTGYSSWRDPTTACMAWLPVSYASSLGLRVWEHQR